MQLKDGNNKNLQATLSKQSRKYTRSQSIKYKQHILTIELDDEIIDQPISRLKTKKLTGGELIAIKIDKWIAQNAASLEAKRVESLKPEAKMLPDMKI